jgi:two-component system NtrC family sensor kinase
MRAVTDAPHEHRDSHDRITGTITHAPQSEEIARDADSKIHGGVELPPRWIERLFVATCELPTDDGEEAVTRSVLETIASILPEHGVGACLILAEGRQQVIKLTPHGEEHRGAGMNPTRLFPGYSQERVADVEGDGTGASLHIACDDSACDDDRAPVARFVSRAAIVLKRGLFLARKSTEAKEAAAELRALNSHMVQAEKLASLGQIAAGVVHELNNPLTSIVAYTDYLTRKALAKGDAADPDDIERLRRIGESAGRMLRFTRDLVTYSRPSSEIAVPVTIHNVIDQALAFCEHVVAEVGARVERRFGDGIPQVRGMPEQLAQVFVNLVTNACHAMPLGTGVLIVVTESTDNGKSVRIVVADNGHGIAGDHLTRVFAPFFTTKGEGRGTGLGLSIVKNIVENHSGQIHAERAVEGGTRFVLVLPAL